MPATTPRSRRRCRATRPTVRGRSPAPGLLATFATVCALLIAPAVARADTSSSLTVIGTSDVSDSGLITNVIQPAFAKAYPQYTFKYIGTATGTAISGAESGAQGASALIVHAASLENQFVAGGFSYERYGRALFLNDFVLGGPKADPAGVGANGAHNIARALADVAAAGIAGKATFVSRGGTPGTTVQEHKFWQLASTAGLAPAGLLLCTVNATSGGGETPIAPGNGVSASGQPCPSGGALPTGSQLPSWYAVTGLTQGPNVQNADACNGYPSGPNHCYVLSDRGTFDYLASGTDPAGRLSNLTIVTRTDTASAPGGAYALVNYFHGYIINPSKPGETVNLPAAKAFLDLLTSPALQGQLKSYLGTADSGGPPFVADASPVITASGIPHTYRAGRPVTVTGAVTNAEPGYPPLAGQPIAVDEVAGLATLPVATGRTNATGGYAIRFVPPVTGQYEIVTPQIAQVENASLSPVFGDLLSPAATAPVRVTVHSATRNVSVRAQGGRLLVLGTVVPGTGHVRATVTVLARPAGTRSRYRRLATERLVANQANFAVAVAVRPGEWQIRITYHDSRAVVAAPPRTFRVRVGTAPSATVRLRSLRVRRGSVTLRGVVAPPSARAQVEVLALDTAPGAQARFRVVGRVRLDRGTTAFTIHATLRRGERWVVQAAYLRAGQPAAFSGLRIVP